MKGCKGTRRHSWTSVSENSKNHTDCARLALKEISPRSAKNIVVSRAVTQSRARRHSICEASYLTCSPKKNRLNSFFPLNVELKKEQSKNLSVLSPRACSLSMHGSDCVVGARAEHLRNLEWFRERPEDITVNEKIDGKTIFDVIGKAGEDFRSFVLNDAYHPECT